MIHVAHPPISSEYHATDSDRMMTMMLNLKQKRKSPRRQWREHRDEDELLPGMIQSPSNSYSSSSSEEHGVEITHGSSPLSPPEFSSSSRMHQRFAMGLKNSNHSKGSNKGKHRGSRNGPSIDEPSNSSIFMGADIIRRQLSCENPKSLSRRLPFTTPFAKNNAKNSTGRTSMDSENWDPWRTDKDPYNSRGTNGLRSRILDYSNHSDDSAKSNDPKRAQAILFNGDKYFDTRDTSKTAMAPSHAAIQKEELRKFCNNNTKTSNLKNCMVQRVSELDDSTFASSSIGNGYLPTNLMSSLNCGGFENPITNWTNSQLPTTNVPTAKAKTNSPTTQVRTDASIQEEELETSTLDFLANLHVKEEDLNFVFKTLEHQQSNLQAQSGIPVQCVERSSLSNSNTSSNKKELTSSSHVTAAATPYEKMVSSRSSFHDELLKNPAYRHAMKAGTLWQSLCSQHVRFPAQWWDGQDPVGPPMGSDKKRTKPWTYLGRHRVQGDHKLIKIIGNRASSGRILLHLIVRDEITGKPIEDIACGCYHPNARGVRTTKDADPKSEDCRDVWISHRRRVPDRVLLHEDDDDTDDEDDLTPIESLLRHQNKGRVHASPLGAQGGKHSITNQNLRIVFGSKPPVYTVYCSESGLFELFQSKLDGSIPASVALLRHYLRYQMN